MKIPVFIAERFRQPSFCNDVVGTQTLGGASDETPKKVETAVLACLGIFTPNCLLNPYVSLQLEGSNASLNA